MTKPTNEYMRDYMLDRYHSVMEVARHWLGNEYSECGDIENLHFHHIDPSQKTFAISKGWSRKPEEFWNEVNKCVLLCRNCHRTEHLSKADCGTPQRYWRGCRCDPCTSANTDYHRSYMQGRNVVQGPVP